MQYRLLLLALIVGGCAPEWDALLSRQVKGLRQAMGSGPSGDAVVLAYDVGGHDGAWRWDVVVGNGVFAERRVSVERGTSYAFGDGPHGTWLQVGEAPPRGAPNEWRRLARTRAAFFGLDFLRPEDAEEAVYMPYDETRWEYVYRPSGGRTLTFSVREESQRPDAFDVLDELGRLTWCEDIEWVVRHGRYVPGRMTCGAINGEGHVGMRTLVRLAGARLARAAPAWAALAAAPDTAPCQRASVEAPMRSELRPELAVTANGIELPFVLDSGAWHTYIDAEAARVMGVVPTGEVPLYLEPPWLPSGSSWVGVVDRLTVEGIPLDGARVMVMDGLAPSAGTAGLLGADFFRRFVVDVDTPNRVVRLVPHDRFAPPQGSTPMYLHGTLGGSMMVTGEITGIARGDLVLDTGAQNRVVVHAPAMAAVNPRRRGSSVGRWYGDMVQTPDYLAEIGGLSIGPFDFPQMPAWGRDHERDRIGGGIALVGMGTMRHLRMSFDVRNRTVYATAGSGYQALARSGLELDDSPDGGAYVTYVVPGSPAADRGIRNDDTLVGVDATAVYDAVAARRLIAAHDGAITELTLHRSDVYRDVRLALEAPADVINDLAPPPSRERISVPACTMGAIASRDAPRRAASP